SAALRSRDAGHFQSNRGALRRRPHLQRRGLRLALARSPAEASMSRSSLIFLFFGGAFALGAACGGGGGTETTGCSGNRGNHGGAGPTSTSSGKGGTGGSSSTGDVGGAFVTSSGTSSSGGTTCDHDPNVDGDGDGWTGAQGDCNDCDPNVNPGAIEVKI